MITIDVKRQDGLWTLRVNGSIVRQSESKEVVEAGFSKCCRMYDIMCKEYTATFTASFKGE